MQDQIEELEAFGEMGKTHSLIAVLQTVSKASESSITSQNSREAWERKKIP